MTIAFAQLKTSYENDMKEVQILTEVLKNSIVSLEFQLEQKNKIRLRQGVITLKD